MESRNKRKLLTDSELDNPVRDQPVDQASPGNTPVSNTVTTESPDLDVNSLTRLSYFLSPADRVALSQCNHHFFQVYHPLTVRDFLRATIRGEETAALEMLRANPALLMERGHPEKGITTDYSGRKYSGLTAFQIALCALDNEMAEKMKAIFLEAYPETGQAELDNQFTEIFPKGIEAHCASQTPFDFSRMVEVISQSSEADVEAALNKEQNDSLLCQTLNQFREAFTNLSREEKIFNPQHLIQAFQLYDDNFDRWNNWNKRDLFWRQVVGFVQRFLPANIAQDVAQGIYYRVEEHEEARRSFNFRFGDGSIFPLDFDSHSGLGFDCVGCWWCPARRPHAAAPSRSIFETYVKQKQLACQLMQPTSKRDEVRRCIIL